MAKATRLKVGAFFVRYDLTQKYKRFYLCGLKVARRAGEKMLFTRKNPLGGRRLNTFPIDEDEQGNMGFKLGYCAHCGEPLICRITEAREITEQFVGGINEYYKFIGKVREKQKPKTPFSVWVAKWLLRNQKDLSEQLKSVEEDFKG